MGSLSHGVVTPTITGPIAIHTISHEVLGHCKFARLLGMQSSCLGVTLYPDAAFAMLIFLYSLLQNMVMWRARIGWQEGMPEPNVSM